MGGDIDGANANDGAAEGKKCTYDEEGEQMPGDLTKRRQLVALPVYIFRSRHFLLFYHNVMLSIQLELLLNFRNAATAATPDEAMGAALEKVMVVEVAQTFYLRFLILEMYICKFDFRINIQGLEFIHQLHLFFPALFELFRVSFAKIDLQLLLAY